MRFLYNNIGIDKYDKNLFDHPDYEYDKVDAELMKASSIPLAAVSLDKFGDTCGEKKCMSAYSQVYGYSCYPGQFEKAIKSYSAKLINHINSYKDIDVVILTELCIFDYKANYEKSFKYSFAQFYPISYSLKLAMVEFNLRNIITTSDNEYGKYLLDNKKKVIPMMINYKFDYNSIYTELDKNYHSRAKYSFIKTLLGKLLDESKELINNSRKMYFIGSNTFKIKPHALYNVSDQYDKVKFDKEFDEQLFNYIQVATIPELNIDIINVHKRALSDKFSTFYIELFVLTKRLIESYKSNNLFIIGDFNNTDRKEIIEMDKFVKDIDKIERAINEKYKVKFYIPSLQNRVYNRELVCYENDTDRKSGIKNMHLGFYVFMLNYMVKNIKPVDNCLMVNRMSSHMSFTFDLVKHEVGDLNINPGVKEESVLEEGSHFVEPMSLSLSLSASDKPINVPTLSDVAEDKASIIDDTVANLSDIIQEKSADFPPRRPVPVPPQEKTADFGSVLKPAGETVEIKKPEWMSKREFITKPPRRAYYDSRQLVVNKSYPSAFGESRSDKMWR